MSDQDRPVPIALDLPDATDLTAVDAAEIEIIRLAAQRLMSPLAALRFIRMLDHRRKVIADREFEAEMERIEELRKKRAAGA
jgi:hypothetical protein